MTTPSSMPASRASRSISSITVTPPSPTLIRLFILAPYPVRGSARVAYPPAATMSR